MKKFFLVLVAILFCVISYGQYDAKIIKVPNANSEFRTVLQNGDIIYQIDIQKWWGITATVSSFATLNTTIAKVDISNQSVASYFSKSGNSIFPYLTTDNLAIGKTSATAKLDVAGSFKMVANNEFSLCSGNPYNIFSIIDGAYFQKYDSVSGGYYNVGVSKVFNGKIGSSLYWAINNPDPRSLKVSSVTVDSDEVTSEVYGGNYGYAYDINKGFGFDFKILKDTLKYSALRMFQGDSVCVNNEPSSIEMRSDIFKFTVNKKRENSLYLSGGGMYYINPKADTIFSIDTNSNTHINGIYKDTIRIHPNMYINSQGKIMRTKPSFYLASGDSILIGTSLTASGSIFVDSLGMILGRAFIDISYNPTADTCLVDSTFSIKGNIRIGKKTANKVNIYNWTKYVWVKNLTVGTIRITYEFLKPE